MKKEIILRPSGTAELIDAHGNTLWSSDGDEDFREDVSQEFLTENDIDDILDYLAENEFLTDNDVAKFESGEWDVTEESLPSEEGVENEDSLESDDDEPDFIDSED